MCKMYGKFFNDENEPESWDENFNNLYKNYFNGENLPVYPLDYFYNKEKQSRKKLKILDNINPFIDDDPYIGTKYPVEDLSKIKQKVIKIRKNDEKDYSPSLVFAEEKKKKYTKKKKGRKKKNKDGLNHIIIKRIK